MAFLYPALDGLERAAGRMPVWQAAAWMMIAVLASGCAGKVKGVMAPVSVTPGAATSKVKMLVATTRSSSDDAATLFSGERSSTPSMTAIDISIPLEGTRKIGTVQWPKRLPANPKTDFAVTAVSQLHSRAEGSKWFHQHLVEGHAFVFVHGFNNTYEDSVFRLSQIVHDSGIAATPILFTWPSRARLFDYNYDKESTNFSRTALENTIRLLSRDRDVRDITILAHSMGTWLTMEALRQMGIRSGRVDPKVRNVILASPDIDIDVFAKQYVEMGSPKPKFTIFVSQDDKALAASRFISGGVSRVGAINPATEPYRSKLERAGITAIDLTQVETDDGLNHGKFAESPEVVRLIGKRLATGQPLTESDVTLGDGVVSVVAGATQGIGAAAVATAAAPAAIAAGPKRKHNRSADIEETLRSDPDAGPLTQ